MKRRIKVDMRFDGYDILFELVKRREISLRELCEKIPNKFNDYRDFYTVASLYTSEYIDVNWKRNQANWDTTKNKLVAEEFWNFAYGTDEYSYRAAQQPDDIDNLDVIRIFVTSKADLYFHEQRKKRFDRLTTLEIGIAVGIISAVAAGFFTNYFQRSLENPTIIKPVQLSNAVNSIAACRWFLRTFPKEKPWVVSVRP